MTKVKRLVFGTRMRSGSYTVRPSRTVVDQTTGLVKNTRPIRVYFKEHQCDLDQQSEAGRWDEIDIEEGREPGWTRQMVEDYMLRHPDFGRVDGRGIFLDTRTKQPVVAEQHIVGLEGAPTRVCLAFLEEGDEVRQCDLPADGESEFCAKHMAEKLANE